MPSLNSNRKQAPTKYGWNHGADYNTLLASIGDRTCKYDILLINPNNLVYSFEACKPYKRDCDTNYDRSGEKLCYDESFLCKSEQRCIARYFVCDGMLDCGDGSDEEGCSECHTYMSTSSAQCVHKFAALNNRKW